MASSSEDEYEQLPHTSIHETPSTPFSNPPAGLDVPHKAGYVADLLPHEVRWFYKLDDGKLWIPFRGCDSLLIEITWRQWAHLETDQSLIEQAKALTPNGVVVVLEGLYELCIEEKKVKPIYWEGNGIWIVRGTWFQPQEQWQPIEASLSDDIEQEHLKHFRGQRIPEHPVYLDKGPKPVLAHLDFPDFTINWNSVIDTTLVYNSRLSRFITLSSTTKKLRRAYHEDAKFEDKAHEVHHLVFVIHGIGQKRQVNQIVLNATEIREVSKGIISKCFPDVLSGIVFIPVEWRVSLKLDDGLVDSITPPHVESLRQLLNTTVLDIMYYTSPLYREEITQGLLSLMNRLYSKFCNLNPTFEKVGGQVHIVAHSLGSVISYDLITHWSPLELYDKYIQEQVADCMAYGSVVTRDLVSQFQQATERIIEHRGALHKVFSQSQRHLDFKVENFFMLGSPLGVFLALRGFGGDGKFVPSQERCSRMFNIFQLSDPVAYRLEPLMHRTYAKLKPVRIQRWDATLEKHVYHAVKHEFYVDRIGNEMKLKKEPSASDLVAEALKAKSVDIPVASEATETLSDKGSAPGSPTSERRQLQEKSSSWGPSALLGRLKYIRSGTVTKTAACEATARAGSMSPDTGSGRTSPDPDALTTNSTSNDDTSLLNEIPEEQRLTHRLDFALREGRMQAYLSAVYAHTSYWNSYDVVMFMLTHVFAHGADNQKDDKKETDTNAGN